MVKVLIVDDHTLMRLGIRRLLETMPDIEIVGDAQNGEEALKLIKKHNPAVVLLDMKMPGMDGWEVICRLKKTHPEIKVIALTSVNSETMPSKVLQLGAMGYLTKTSTAEEILEAIQSVSQGKKFLSAEIAQQMAINSLQDNINSPFDKLSEREMQVMLMITTGMSVQEISKRLFLSSKTVNGYRYKLFEKLSVSNDVELTYLALKHQIIEQPLNS